MKLLLFVMIIINKTFTNLPTLLDQDKLFTLTNFCEIMHFDLESNTWIHAEMFIAKCDETEIP